MNISTFKAFAIYFFILTIIFPNIYLFLSPDNFYLNFMVELVDQKVISEGLVYSLISYGILITVVFFTIRTFDQDKISYQAFISYYKWKNILFLLAIIGLFLQVLLNFYFGVAQTNLTSQRPLWATFLGYTIAPLNVATYVYLFLCIFTNNLFKQSSFILILLLILNGVLIGSRSSFLTFLDLFLICSVLSQKNLKINITFLLFFIFISLFFSFIGHIVRGGDTSSLFYLALLRFFHNNSVLYLALTDFKGINDILMLDQPANLLSHMFSFVMEREQLPSSVRLPEYWGQPPNEIRGHFVGYVYGWLGLSYGLLKWGGIFLTFLFSYFFIISKKLLKSSSIANVILFYFLITTFHEYMFNLGLDSFFEVTFKKFIYCLVLYIILIIMSASSSFDKVIKK